MGIKPSGDNPIIVPPDNIQSRWGEWEADLDAAGQVAGEVNLETWALADSANSWISENSGKFQGLLQESGELGGKIEKLQEDYEKSLGEQGTITESIRGLSEDLGNKVNASTFTEYEEGMEAQLWGENGELWRINSVLWDEQVGWNATQERLNAAQDEINTLNDDRNDLQDQMLELNREDIDRQDQYISRFLFVPGFGAESDDYFSVTKVGAQWRVEAKGTWTGRYTLQSAYNTSRGWEPVIDVETVPRNDPTNPRVRYHNGAEYSTLINYWVRNAVHKVDDKSTGSYTTGAWTTRDDLRFNVPITAEYSLYYRVVWGAATYNDTYSFRILRNGNELMKWGPMTNVGPLFPGGAGAGVRTRTISRMNVPLSEGDVLTFQTYSNASQPSQRSVRSSERKISWLMPATQENMEGRA